MIHELVNEIVFQISDMALCVAFALGPLTGGAIIEVLNFEYLLLICGVINLGTNFKLNTFEFNLSTFLHWKLSSGKCIWMCIFEI